MIPQPRLGMGTWGMGGTYERDPSNVNASIEVIKAGLDAGLKIIDVAERYGEGLSEEIVGSAIRGRRTDTYLISKVWKTNLRYDDVLRACEGSLRRLAVDCIDLYLVHWPSEEVPLSETMRAMERLVEEGMVAAIGVSNFSAGRMEEAQRCLKNAKLVANEFEYNLIARDAERDIIPYCQTNDIDMIAYRPFAKGVLSSSHTGVLQELASAYGKTPNQVILNWLLSQGMVAIPKSSNPEHVQENVGALGWNLSGTDIERLRSA